MLVLAVTALYLLVMYAVFGILIRLALTLIVFAFHLARLIVLTAGKLVGLALPERWRRAALSCDAAPWLPHGWCEIGFVATAVAGTLVLLAWMGVVPRAAIFIDFHRRWLAYLIATAAFVFLCRITRPRDPDTGGEVETPTYLDMMISGLGVPVLVLGLIVLAAFTIKWLAPHPTLLLLVGLSPLIFALTLPVLVIAGIIVMHVRSQRH